MGTCTPEKTEEMAEHVDKCIMEAVEAAIDCGIRHGQNGNGETKATGKDEGRGDKKVQQTQ